jgi:hypothetical protein
MVTIDRHAVSAQECVPPVVQAFWPDVIPVHAISIVDVIGLEGKREIIVLTDSDQPPWVTSGLLTLVKSDVETDWSAHYPYEDDDDYEDDEDEDDDEYDDE